VHRIIIFVLVLFCYTPISYGEDQDLKVELSRKKSELGHVKKRIQEKKQKVQAFARKKSSVTSELRSIERDLSESREEIRSLNSQVDKLSDKIKRNSILISRTREDTKALRAVLNARLVELYKFTRSGHKIPFYTLYSRTDKLRYYRFMDIILNHDLELVDKYEHDILMLDEKEKELIGNKGRLADLKAKKERNECEIQTGIQRGNKILRSVKSRKSTYIAAIFKLEKHSKRLQSMIEELNRTIEKEIRERGLGCKTDGFAALMGKLDPPVPGKILPLFGRQEDPTLDTFTFHKGVDILAPMDSKIKAVYDGRVLFSGWFKGYGKVIIMDHGNSYCTLFAHASKLLKKVNDEVTKGEVIALVGDTDSLKGPHLYFEIRYRAKPQNPMDWLVSVKK